MKLSNVLIAALMPVVAACATPEILPPRDGTVPIGVDLSGNWRMQPGSASDQQRIREAIRKTDGVDDDEAFGMPGRQSRNAARNGSRRIKGGLVYVFLELGESLKVSQTPYGLFISFDRSVVEEYRFGGKRIVTVGEVEAQRAAGWEGNTLVVETLDRKGMKLTERFRLIDNGDVLERTITLRSRALEEETVVQLFDRESE